MAQIRRVRRALKKKARDHKKDLLEVSTLTCKLFDGDKEKTKEWIYTPNSYFFDSSPLELILIGKGSVVINFLKERLGNDVTETAKGTE